jgi:integrase
MSQMPSIKLKIKLPPGSPGMKVDLRLGERRSHHRHSHHREDGARPTDLVPESHRITAQPSNAITFRQAAEAYIEGKRSSWKSEKHAEQWTATLERFAYPVIGERSVADIDIGAVLEVLEAPVSDDEGEAAGPFWNARAETASRVRGRIERILNWARVRGYRQGENPARWKGNLDEALPSKKPRVKHHAALPYDEIAAFVADLHTRDGVSARALEFCILTAARTGEVLGARWSEIDLVAKLWTIPGERMKAGAEHRVPLTDRCIEILGPAKAASELVFPGPRGQLSNMALLSVLARMNRDDVTVHGFRSTFRDWASEATDHPREVAEMALAHTIANKVEAAYRRGDLFEKRRRLMDDWAAACGVSVQPALLQAAE